MVPILCTENVNRSIKMKYILWTLLCYLSGSVLYSYLIPLWLKRIDIRNNTDDQNPGAGNAFKNSGKTIGFLCLVLEILKGLLPILAFLRTCSILYSVFHVDYFSFSPYWFKHIICRICNVHVTSPRTMVNKDRFIYNQSYNHLQTYF